MLFMSFIILFFYSTSAHGGDSTILSREKRIVGGNLTGVGQFPYAVVVRVRRGWCSGTIIHKKWVLTAAHCVKGNILYVESERGKRNSPPCCSQKRNILRAIAHPHYNGNGSGNDIGLLELDEEFVFYDHVLPIAFPKFDMPIVLYDAIALGWGPYEDDVREPPVLRYSHVNVGNNLMCEAFSLLMGYKYKIADDKLCAIPQDRLAGICRGDSGGPVVKITNTGRHELIGLNSQATSLCGKPNMVNSVYVLISPHIEWINSITGLGDNNTDHVDEIVRSSEACIPRYSRPGPMPTSCPLFEML